MANQIILLCEHYRREIESLGFEERHDDIEVLFFKGRCGLPPLDWKELQDVMPEKYETLHALNGGCISNLPDEHQGIYRQRSYKLNHCLDLFISSKLTAHFAGNGYYMVSPGWLQKWRNYLGQQGFDRETAREFYNETAEKILLLDTGVDDEAKDLLAAFSEYIGLPAESIEVGLEYFDLLLSNIITKNRLDYSGKMDMKKYDENRKELADFTMALDLLNSLVSIRDEDEVLLRVKEIFTMLFAPREVVIRLDGQHGKVKCSGINDRDDCISLPLQGSSGSLGYIDILGLRLPQHKKQYLKIAGKIINICGMAIENARHYKVIKELSNTDGLTGLANRRRLEEHLNNEWRRMKRDKKPLTIVMCDIDYFKIYNDYYGHQAGDDCLREVAGLLKKYCRRPGDLAARYGGEEFMLVLPDTEQEGALAMVELIRQEVEALTIEHKESPVSDYVTASFGVATAIPGPESTLQKLRAESDRLLYKAKEAGRNRVSN